MTDLLPHLEALRDLLADGRRDAVWEAARDAAAACRAGDAEALARHRRSLCCYEAPIARGAERRLRRSPAAALRAARALWRLLDAPGDAEARTELAALGAQLAMAVAAGRPGAAALEALADWWKANEWGVHYALRRLAPDSSTT